MKRNNDGFLDIFIPYNELFDEYPFVGTYIKYVVSGNMIYFMIMIIVEYYDSCFI